MAYIGLNNEYDEKNCDNIFSFLYKIKYTDKKRGIYTDDIENYNDAYFVSISSKKDENTIARNGLVIDKDQYRLLPLMRKNVAKSNDKQRDVMVIYGSSGSGKSFIADKIVRSFISINQQPVYYVSSKNMLADSSFDVGLYQQFITFKNFLKLFETPKKLDDFTTGNMFDNSLIVIDDVMLDDKHIKKQFWTIMNVILKLKRMNNISLIYICHEVSDYSHTRALFNEMTVYVSFTNDLRNRNSLILSEYLKLDKDEQKHIANADSRWTAVYCRKKLILTENSIRILK